MSRKEFEKEVLKLQVELVKPTFADSWPATKWKLQPADGDKIESVARAHLTRFLTVALKMATDKVPALGPVGRSDEDF